MEPDFIRCNWVDADLNPVPPIAGNWYVAWYRRGCTGDTPVVGALNPERLPTAEGVGEMCRCCRLVFQQDEVLRPWCIGTPAEWEELLRRYVGNSDLCVVRIWSRIPDRTVNVSVDPGLLPEMYCDYTHRSLLPKRKRVA